MRAMLLIVALLAVLLAVCSDDGSRVLRAGFDDAPVSDSARAAPGLRGVPVATSFLGEPLYPLPLGDAEARLLARVDSAEARVALEPGNPDRLIWLGRRLAYAGRYREAIEAFTDGIERFPDDPRFYRHRGHRYITVRELDRAVADLEHAARLVSGRDDQVEPDGQPNAAGIPRSTLQTNIWYHLGLARYLQDDLEGAAYAFERGFQLSPNDDMRVAMADWLWLANKRLGLDDEAADAIAFVEPEMDILENHAYHRRLLLYRGELPRDSLIPAPAPGASEDDRALQMATYGYGLGTWHLIRGDPLRARRTYQEVLETGYWPAFGYIAAEAALARWDDLAPPEPEPADGYPGPDPD